MRGFIARGVCFLLIQVAIGWALLFPTRDFRPDEHFTIFQEKVARMTEPGRQRLVFVGGSSVLYGIDSSLFREHLQCKPVNLGLNFGLGIKVHTRVVRSCV